MFGSSIMGVALASAAPSPVAGYVAWYKKGTGITSSGGAVSQWADQSGNGRHLVQATGSRQPALQGDQSILFDGVDDYLRTADFTLNQPCSFFLRFKQITWTSADRIMAGKANDTQVVQSGVSPDLIAVGSGGTLSLPGPALNTYCSLAFRINGTSTSLKLNSNAPVVMSGGNTMTGNPGGFTLGARADPLGFSNIQVVEALIYPTFLSDTDAQLVNDYLATL